METLNAVLYLTGLACFVLALRQLPRAATTRRGTINALSGCAIFASLLTTAGFGLPAGALVVQVMALLAVVLAAFAVVERRLAAARGH